MQLMLEVIPMNHNGTVIDTNHNDINSYVDGVCITCGSPRQHVWTLFDGLSSFGNHTWTGQWS